MATGRNGSAILFKIEVNGSTKVVSGQISGSHEGTADVIDTTNKLSSNGAKTSILGEHGWTYTVECKVDPGDSTNASYSDVHAAFKSKAILDYTYGGVVVGAKYYSGECNITSLSESAPQNDAETFSMSVQVTGDESESTVTT